MLDFFVLGEVPGTNIIITFSWVLLAGAVLLSFGQASVLYNRFKLTPAGADSKPAAKSKNKNKTKTTARRRQVK